LTNGSYAGLISHSLECIKSDKSMELFINRSSNCIHVTNVNAILSRR